VATTRCLDGQLEERAQQVEAQIGDIEKCLDQKGA
jgi:hypothetical protein